MQTMIFKSNDEIEELLPKPVVRELFGVSDMALWRWNRDAALGFPKALKIRGRCYFRKSEIARFLRTQAAG